jgi:alkylation response protein AidB-like acyl-CoA dehydrogenase
VTTTSSDALRSHRPRLLRPGDPARPPATATAEAFPAELLPGLAELGILGAVIPEELGGAGLDAAGYRVVIEELGAADSSIRSLVSVNLGLVGKSIAALGHRRAAGALAAGPRRGASSARSG